MPNRNRQRGDYFERRTQDALQAHGWIVVRSAGSLGVADLVALHTERTPMLVSCKLDGRMSRKETHALCDAAEAAGAFGVLAHLLKPGWVRLEIITRHGNARLPDIHMPSQRRKAAV